MAASTINRSAFTNGTTPWNASTINSSIYDKIDELFGGVGTYATFEFGGAVKVTGALTPVTNNTPALGSSSLMWADLFLGDGGVINFNNGDVTITHSTNTLAFAGASTAYTFADGPVRPASNDGAALGVSGTAWSDLFLASGGVINFNAGDVTITHSSDTLTISGAASGVIINGMLEAASTRLQEATAFFSSSGNTLIGWSSGIAGYTNGSLILQPRSSAACPIVFVTGNGTGVDRGRVTDTGEFWIGYTTDQGAYLLQVNSQIFATNATIATSDARFKTDVQPVTQGLAAVKALRPVQFAWKKHPVHNFIDGTDVGFLAQEVQAALAGRDYRGAVVTKNGTGANEFLGMADSKLIPLLVAAVQELSAQVDALRAQ